MKNVAGYNCIKVNHYFYYLQESFNLKPHLNLGKNTGDRVVAAMTVNGSVSFLPGAGMSFCLENQVKCVILQIKHPNV